MELYHPRRSRNEILDPKVIDGILRKANHVTIALSRDDEPYVVTMSYGFDEGNSCLYFHCANRGDKLDYIKANSRACATVVEDHGYLKTLCDHDYASVVMRGELTIVESLDEKKHALQVLLNHLEENPKPIFERNIKSDASYDGVTILKLAIASKIGKKYLSS